MDRSRQVRRSAMRREGMADRSVIVRIQHGLGNQLFQYAAAKALSNEWAAPLMLDVQNGNDHDREFRLPYLGIEETIATQADVRRVLQWGGNGAKMAMHRIIRRVNPSHRYSPPTVYSESHFHYDTSLELQMPPIYLIGHFQSHKYFSSISETLRAKLRKVDLQSSNARNYAEEIDASRESICVHVRRGDYVSKPANFAKHGILSPDYYCAAVAILSAVCSADTRFFLFSDSTVSIDIRSAFRQPTIIDRNGQSDWEDMLLMARCKHHIIANSSFSWWGAWLANHADQRVVAPRQWFRPEFMRRLNTSDLMPDGWILL